MVKIVILIKKSKVWSKNRNFGHKYNQIVIGQKSYFGKNRNFGQKSKFCQNRNFGQKSNFGKKLKFGQKSKCGSKIKILVKNLIFVKKTVIFIRNRNFGQKSNQIFIGQKSYFGKKSKFWSKIQILVKIKILVKNLILVRNRNVLICGPRVFCIRPPLWVRQHFIFSPLGG